MDRRPHRLHPSTSLKEEVFFLNHLAAKMPGLPVPHVLGYGQEGYGGETEAFKQTWRAISIGGMLAAVARWPERRQQALESLRSLLAEK